jgi:hypothetical protein
VSLELNKHTTRLCLILVVAIGLTWLPTKASQNDSSPNVVPMPAPEKNKATFVLIPPTKKNHDDVVPVQTQNILDRISTFCPDQTIILQPPSKGEDFTTTNPNTALIPVRNLPSHSTQKSGFEIVSWLKNALWIYLDPDENFSDQQITSIHSTITDRIISQTPSHLFIVTPENFWQKSSGIKLWIELGQYLLDSKTPTTVFISDTNRFSHWQKDGIDFFSLNALNTIKKPDPTEGVFDGVLWGTIDRDGTVDIRILPLYGMLSAQDVSVQNQKIVETLQSRLRATPILDSDPVTNVSFINPLATPLELNAAWTFSQDIVQVDPKIVGFTLAPGEVFEQSFRLTLMERNGIELKFIEPEFRLETEIPGPGGIPRRINLKTRPWCTLSGTAVRKEEPPQIDGDLVEWTGPGLAISHPSQVISGQDGWTGPADLSANVLFGIDGDNFYVAISVTDDDIENEPRKDSATDQACVLVAVNPDGKTESTTPAPLQICVTPSGTVEISGAITDPDATIVASARPHPEHNGYDVEIAIPVELLQDANRTNGYIKTDINLIDVDAGDKLTTKSTLSGRGIDPTLFAKIQCSIDSED